MTDVNQEYSLGGFGARLKEAREALHLSQKDAALRLHLSPNIVQILESENFQKAPPATFIRGYLRSYARLLNFTEDDINTALTYSGFDSPAQPPVIPMLRTETMQTSDRYVQWISTATVLGLFVFVGLWWGMHSSSNNTVARTATLPAAQIIQPVQTVVTTTATPSAPATVVQQTTPAQPVTTTVTTNPATVVTTAQPPAAQPTPLTAEPQPLTPANPAAPAAIAGTTTGTTTAPTMPATVTPPGTEPLSTMPAEDSANTTVASADDSSDDDAPKKRSARRHKQNNNVSGFAMALPEPGL